MPQKSRTCRTTGSPGIVINLWKLGVFYNPTKQNQYKFKYLSGFLIHNSTNCKGYAQTTHQCCNMNINCESKTIVTPQ